MPDTPKPKEADQICKWCECWKSQHVEATFDGSHGPVLICPTNIFEEAK